METIEQEKAQEVSPEQLQIVIQQVRGELGKSEVVLAGIVAVLERLEPRQVQRLRSRIVVAMDDLIRERSGTRWI